MAGPARLAAQMTHFRCNAAQTLVASFEPPVSFFGRFLLYELSRGQTLEEMLHLLDQMQALPKALSAL